VAAAQRARRTYGCFARVTDRDDHMPPTDGLQPGAADTSAANDSVARTLARFRGDASRALLGPIASFPKFADELSRLGPDPTPFLAREIDAFVDYLTLRFHTGDVSYRHLYVGEKLKQLYLPDATADEQHAAHAQVAAADTAALLDFFRRHLAADALAALEAELREIERVVASRGGRTLDVLLVGDCLYLDLLAFATAPCLEDDVTIRPTFVTTKNPAAAREQVAALRGRKFDAVFYSPFSYEFAHEMTRLQDWRQVVANTRDLARLTDAALAEATKTLDLLTDLFECNCFVHNTAGVRRHDNTLRERAKNLMTRGVRKQAARRLNERLADYVARRNAASFPHLFVFDEAWHTAGEGDDALGRLFYDADLQHPAALGKHLAEPFRDVLFVQAHLLNRKLVASDLDNTLWAGVIGEGAGVSHHVDRQQALKHLQKKGVVLAVNSKNDPKNVRWDGGLLCDDDFVCRQVNWDPKVLNLQRIARQLNLKTKDFVFIDDRPDERELVRVAMPEVLSLDATDGRTWRLLDLWASLLDGQGDAADRTQFYKQREARERFLDEQPAQAAADRGRLFAELGLTVDIRQARPADLKRAAELINRTNQFNTTGARTTLREITAWHDDLDWRVLVVDAADKFGAMGMVSVLVLHDTADALDIPAFVLSCRVFGYGIETALLNHVKRLAADAGRSIVAPLVRTMHNDPCATVYADNGFEGSGERWTSAGAPTAADPSWLNVRSDTAAAQVS
jgi:FkbH-like protein